MSLRRATAWVLECDAPACLAIVVPEIHKATQRESEHGALLLTLNTNPDAFAAARTARWASSPRGDYCPEHAYLGVQAPAGSTTDVPLPGRTDTKTTRGHASA